MIQPSTSSSDGILWCEIVVSSFFSEYFFEGLKPEDYPNEEIILEMPTDDFHRALKIDRPDKTIPTTLKLKLSREDFSAGQKRAHETTVGGSKQPVIVIQLNLQQASTGRDPRDVHKAFARTNVSFISQPRQNTNFDKRFKSRNSCQTILERISRADNARIRHFAFSTSAIKNKISCR